MKSKIKIIIEWETFKIGKKIYSNYFIDGIKEEEIFIISTGNIFDYIEIYMFIKKFKIKSKYFCRKSLFRLNSKQENGWILKNIKNIIDEDLSENKNFLYCDVNHFIIEDLYNCIPMYSSYISHCKLSGLYEFLTRNNKNE